MDTLYETADGTRIVRLTASDEVEALVHLFEAVAHDEGWQPEGELRAYPDRSACFALVVGETLAGGIQLVQPGPEGTLPLQRVWPEIDLSRRQDIAHVLVLALKPEWRGQTELFWLLCMEVWRFCIRNSILELWLEATRPALRWYRRLGWPLHDEGPLRLHWGEECYPCRLSLWEAVDEVLRRAEHSLLYRRIVTLGARDLPEEVVQRLRGGSSGEPAPASTPAAR